MYNIPSLNFEDSRSRWRGARIKNTRHLKLKLNATTHTKCTSTITITSHCNYSVCTHTNATKQATHFLLTKLFAICNCVSLWKWKQNKNMCVCISLSCSLFWGEGRGVSRLLRNGSRWLRCIQRGIPLWLHSCIPWIFRLFACVYATYATLTTSVLHTASASC